MKRRGVVLVIVLIVVSVLALAAYTFAELMVVERKAIDAVGNQTQARMLAESGGDYVRTLIQSVPLELDTLGGLYDNPTLFQGIEVGAGDGASGGQRLSVVSRTFDAQGLPIGVRFGLEDESAKLNVNALAAIEDQSPGTGLAMLMGLPGMTQDIADAILDFVDADDIPRELGAEIEYYGALSPPVIPANGQLDSIDQLLLVRGMSPALLYGLDQDRSGLVDASEQAGVAAGSIDNSTGEMALGWAPFLTVYSRESIMAPDGTPKIDLNMNDLQTLYSQLNTLVGADMAGFIIAYRQNGPYQNQSQNQNSNQNSNTAGGTGSTGTSGVGGVTGGAVGGTTGGGTTGGGSIGGGTAGGGTSAGGGNTSSGGGNTSSGGGRGTTTGGNSGNTGGGNTGGGNTGGGNTGGGNTGGGNTGGSTGSSGVISLGGGTSGGTSGGMSGTGTTGSNQQSGQQQSGQQVQGEAMNGRLPDMTVAARQQIGSLIDLVGAQVQVQFPDAQQAVVVNSPLGQDLVSMATQLPRLLDYVTVAGDQRPGRINVNEAPAAVLRGLPGLSVDLLPTILDQRSLLGGDDSLRHPTWLLTTGLVTVDQMKTLYPYLNGGGSVYRAQVYGIVEGRQITSRIEMIWDGSDGSGRILSWRDLTPLGRGLPVDLLGIGMTTGTGSSP
ncbi:MAG: type II secretion system protein GspK [Pirellulales bacterium]